MNKLKFVSKKKKNEVVSFTERLDHEINVSKKWGDKPKFPEHFTSYQLNQLDNLVQENKKIKELLLIICSNLTEAQQKSIGEALNFKQPPNN